MSHIKKVYSYGIGLFRKNGDQWEILLVRKRISYAFSDFYNGNYPFKNNESFLQHMFDKMTFYEKHIIKTLDYTKIHDYYTLMCQPTFNQKYYSNKHKFERLLKNKNGQNLLRMIELSKNIEKIWELPKGRKMQIESEIEACVREFYEETGVTNDYYKLIKIEKTSVNIFTDDVMYISKFKTGIWTSDKNFTPKIKFSNPDQIYEIDSIEWVNVKNIQLYPMNPNQCTTINEMFKLVK